MFTHAVVLGALGEVGSLLSRSLLASGIPVTQVDSRLPAKKDETCRFLQANVIDCGPDLSRLIQDADCVCVCLPEKVALSAVPKLTAAMSDYALWLDTLSVKSEITDSLASQVGRLEILSINPMFAPALGWQSNGVAVIEAASGSKSDFFKQLLAAWGASVEIVTAAQHDNLTAAIQVATHAAILSFGATLLKLDYNLDTALRLSTPPHRLLITLLYRIVSQNPEVYWDIQAYHPHGTAVRRELIEAGEQMQLAVDEDEKRDFGQMFERLNSLLGPQKQLLGNWAKAIIAQVAQRPQ